MIAARTSVMFAVAICAVACRGGEGGGSGTSGASSTTETTTEFVTSSTTSNGTSDESTSSSTDADTSTTVFADLPPHPTACDDPVALIDVAIATTPEGPMTIDEAWLWLDFCGAGPFVTLVQQPTLDGGVGLEVQIEAMPSGAPPLLGTYPAAVRWANGGSGTIEILGPFTDPREVGTPHPDLHLHAQIEIHDGGYDLSLEVDLIACGVADCSCPCR